MTAKEFLQKAWQIDRRIESRIAEREMLESRVTAGRMTNLSGMPRGGKYDWTDSANRVIMLTERINADIAEMCRIKTAVNDAIDAVEDIRYRELLELRYRNYYTWEKIGEVMGYEVRYIYRLHGEALLAVKVPKEFA